MAQQSGDVGWSVDAFDEEARILQERIAALTADGRISQAEAIRKIAVEDNRQLVKLKTEQARQERQPEAPAQEPPEPEQTRALTFSEDRQPQSPNYNLLKQEQADTSPSGPQPGEGRTLSFSEDRERHSPDYNALKRESAEAGPSQGKNEGRSLGFAEDKARTPDHGR